MSTPASNAPREGDIIYVDLNPIIGHEQGGKRPVLVLSEQRYNAKTGMAFVVPLSTRIKGYPFEVPIEADTPLPTVAIADAGRSIDWRSRAAVRKGTVPPAVLQKVRRRLAQVIGLVA